GPSPAISSLASSREVRSPRRLSEEVVDPSEPLGERRLPSLLAGAEHDAIDAFGQIALANDVVWRVVGVDVSGPVTEAAGARVVRIPEMGRNSRCVAL